MLEIEIVKLKSLVRMPWRARLRYRWMGWRMGPKGRAAVHELTRAWEYEVLFGKKGEEYVRPVNSRDSEETGA